MPLTIHMEEEKGDKEEEPVEPRLVGANLSAKAKNLAALRNIQINLLSLGGRLGRVDSS